MFLQEGVGPTGGIHFPYKIRQVQSNSVVHDSTCVYSVLPAIKKQDVKLGSTLNIIGVIRVLQYIVLYL